jgi:catechol 2,3-dioxygenase-like lactoylglutathione lyase family enzyme
MAQTLFNGTTAVRPADVPNITQAVPFFGVKDIEASLRFYIDGLGFTMTRHWAPEGRIRWCWLELDRVAVMLQEYWKDGRPGGSPAGVPGQGVCICLMCEDAIAVYHNANARGLQPSKPSVENGLWVTSLVDPDGYRLDFESPADVREELSSSTRRADTDPLRQAEGMEESK